MTEASAQVHAALGAGARAAKHTRGVIMATGGWGCLSRRHAVAL
jgi:hypothetical protein